MPYPELKNTPIKETIFSISYNEIIDSECFEKFINLKIIKDRFQNIKPTIDQKIRFDDGKISVFSDSNDGFHLKGEKEIIQVRKGSFSLHHLNEYQKFDSLVETFLIFWSEFDKMTNDSLTINTCSVRYINLIESDSNDIDSRLVQLYPKYSSDREIKNFQNSVQFSYKDNSECILNVATTKTEDKSIILDITVKKNLSDIGKSNNLNIHFSGLRELKNRAFFDSITAQTLIKYI